MAGHLEAHGAEPDHAVRLTEVGRFGSSAVHSCDWIVRGRSFAIYFRAVYGRARPEVAATTVSDEQVGPSVAGLATLALGSEKALRLENTGA
jgi:hypothetical protein